MPSAASYVRVSTEEQREGLSLGAQLAQITARARADGYSLTEATQYGDVALSGANPDRPGYQQMLADAVAARFEVLYVWSFDRLGRDAEELLRARRLLETVGVRLVSVIEGEAASTLVYGIRALIAEEERQRIGERTRLALQRRACEGRYHGGRAPYGYRRMPPPANDELRVEGEEAEIVRRIYRLFVAGAGGTTIAAGLNRDAVAPPLSSRWSANQIRALVENVVYCGKIRFGSEIYSGRHSPIIAQELWEEANLLRRRRREAISSTAGRRPAGRHLLLHGLLRCGRCGAGMSPRRLHARNGVEIYRCIQRTRDSGCTMSAVERTDIDTAVFDYFLRNLLDRQQTLQLAADAQVVARSTQQRERGRLKRRLTVLTTAANRAQQDYLHDRLDVAEWRAIRAQLERERADIGSRLNSLGTEARPSIDGIEALESHLEGIVATIEGKRDRLDGGLDALRTALTLAIEKIEVHHGADRGTLSVTARRRVALSAPSLTEHLPGTRRPRKKPERFHCIEQHA